MLSCTLVGCQLLHKLWNIRISTLYYYPRWLPHSGPIHVRLGGEVHVWEQFCVLYTSTCIRRNVLPAFTPSPSPGKIYTFPLRFECILEERQIRSIFCRRAVVSSLNQNNHSCIPNTCPPTGSTAKQACGKSAAWDACGSTPTSLLCLMWGTTTSTASLRRLS